MADIMPVKALRYHEKSGVRQDLWDTVYLLAADRLADDQRVFFGLLALTRLEPWDTKVVLPGEESPGDAAAALSELLTTGTQVQPVWAEYEDAKGVTLRRMENLAGTVAPVADLEQENTRYRLWAVNDKLAITAFNEDFADRKLVIRRGVTAYQAALDLRERLWNEGRFPREAEFVLTLLAPKGSAGEEAYGLLATGGTQRTCGTQSVTQKMAVQYRVPVETGA